jgi:hypothetical protein
MWLEGGGWCTDEASCLERSTTNLGSSRHFDEAKDWSLCNTNWNVAHGAIAEDAHCISLPYCDGASFSGFRAEAHPVPVGAHPHAALRHTAHSKHATLTFRGIKNLDAAVEWALRHGLSQASQFVLAGGSAGGLATFLHADRVIARVREAVPRVHAWAAPVGGFFLDHDNIGHTSGTPNTPSWELASYTAWMEYIFHMQNLSFGPEGGLPAACGARHRARPHECFMSPHVADSMQERFFLFNSKYDVWQLDNVLGAPHSAIALSRRKNASVSIHGREYTAEDVTRAAAKYGDDFMRQLRPVTNSKQNGGFITSCICHECHWQGVSSSTAVDLRTGRRASAPKSFVKALQHYVEWAEGRASGVLVDPRGPNGDGELELRKECSPWSPAY